MDGLDTVDDIINYFGKGISFITFNYDRSLENFLFTSLNEFLKDKLKTNEIVNIVESIVIIHVYGKTGYLEWESSIDDNFIVPFGKPNMEVFEHAMKAYKMIEIIYEQRKNKEEINSARELITNSDRVLFLGFGFDSLNLKILGMPNNIENKYIFGTAYNQTVNERNKIRNCLLGKSKSEKNIIINEHDCLRLLKDFLE